MERQPRQEAYHALIQLAEQRGYITFDDIMDCADRLDLPIQDFDWLSNSLSTFGIIIYAEAPTVKSQDSSDEYDDFAQSDYEIIYSRITELCPSMEDIVDFVRNTIPPQRREIRNLCYQIREGNEFARKRMIEMHMRLALRVALQRATTYDMDLEDAIGSAFAGLITAVDKYNPDTSGPFASYAALWIVQNISRNQTTRRALIYYPYHKREDYLTIYPILKKHACTTCPMLKEFCEDCIDIVVSRLSCDKADAKEILFQCTPDELFDPLDEEWDYGGKSMIDTIWAPSMEDQIINKVFTEDMRAAVDKALCSLRPKEKDVIRARYGLDGEVKTLEEVGQLFSVTRERIRQIEEKTLTRLRHPSRAKFIKPYWIEL